MKIAVTSKTEKSVTDKAGKCRTFWIYDAIDGRIENKRLLKLPKGHAFRDGDPSQFHPLDAINALITSGLGEKTARQLKEKGIQGVVTSETDPDRAVASFLASNPTLRPSL